MRCYKCGGTYIEHNGILKLDNGYTVSDAKYYKCENCGNLLFPQETCIKLDKIEQEHKDN